MAGKKTVRVPIPAEQVALVKERFRGRAAYGALARQCGIDESSARRKVKRVMDGLGTHKDLADVLGDGVQRALAPKDIDPDDERALALSRRLRQLPDVGPSIETRLHDALSELVGLAERLGRVLAAARSDG